ncbi:MAG: hypothetical protein WDN49_04130 [Acetobacteraceae bacterium]
MLDHVIVTVSDFTRSTAFYAQALKPLGITDFLDYKGQDGHPDLQRLWTRWTLLLLAQRGEAQSGRRSFRFCRQSHAEVNAFFDAAMQRADGEKTAPAPQLQYHPDYYALGCSTPTVTTSRL